MISTGTCQAGSTSTTIVLASAANAYDDYYNGCIVRCTNETPAGATGQARIITDYTGSTRTCTVATWTATPTTGTYEILATEAAYAHKANIAQILGVAVLANSGLIEANATYAAGVALNAIAQPGQEAPAATPSLTVLLGYLYKFLRNKITTTATTLSVFNDDTATVDQKATISDSAGTFTRGEIGTGP